MQAEAVRIGAQARGGFVVPAGHGAQAQHPLSGARPQRDAIGARGRLQLSVAQKPKEIYGADYGHQKKSRFPQIGRDKNRLILF